MSTCLQGSNRIGSAWRLSPLRLSSTDRVQKAIKETFALYEVPKEALVIGLAGVLPYLATSVSTLYLAWDINHASLVGEGFLVSGETAEALLHIIEPLQIGYGAVVSRPNPFFYLPNLIPTPDPLFLGSHSLGL